jgi:hypothetical protein
MPQLPVSKLADGSKTYGSRKEAMQAAMAAVRGGDKHVEVGGAILYNSLTNQYGFTTPAGELNGAHFGARVQYTTPWKVDSLYHTHTAGERSAKFSADDLDMASRLKVPSYILARYDNKIRMYEPGKHPVVKSVEGNFSLGEIVDEGASDGH